MEFRKMDCREWSNREGPAGGCLSVGNHGNVAGIRRRFGLLGRVWRGSRKGLLLLLALGGTLGAVRAAPVRDGHTQRAGTATAVWPSAAPFIGVGGLSLIGMLALRRRARGYQG